MRRAIWFILPLLVMTAGCSTYKGLIGKRPSTRKSYIRQLRDAEQKLGTKGESRWIYHRIVEEPNSFALHFPGYIIGTEKAPTSRITRKKGEPFLEAYRTNIREQYAKKKDAIGRSVTEFGTDLLEGVSADSSRHFVSHIFGYGVSRSNRERVVAMPAYSVYDRVSGTEDGAISPRDAFSEGIVALEFLRTRVLSDVAKKGYTHIFVYAMGWHSDQQEAFRNFNSLFGSLLDEAIDVPGFKPLFLGITWSSSWGRGRGTSTLAQMQRALSGGIKADDADEIGSTWGNYVVNRVALPVKKEFPGVKVVVVGHSFGSRMMTTAATTRDLLPIALRPDPAWKVDLCIGLQPAFDVDRFLMGSGLEGTPYRDVDQHVRKLVYTWSTTDLATGIVRLMGGKAGYSQATAYVKAGKPAPFIFAKVIPNAGAKNEHGIEIIDEGIQHARGWGNSRIVYIDCSEIINSDTYRKGGGGHNDIYNPELTYLQWQMISTFAPVAKP